MNWSEGRHGDIGQIILHAEEHITIEEPRNNPAMPLPPILNDPQP